MTKLALWALLAIESLAPSTRQPYREPAETPEVRHARYEKLASAIASAVEALPEEALPEKGERGRLKLTAAAVAIAHHESGFLLGVRQGKRRGDGGRSWCEFQIMLGKGKTEDGWTGRDLVGDDPTRCAIVGVRTLARSLGACRRMPVLDRLSAYASGKCQAGLPASRAMMSVAARLLRIPLPAESAEA
jgi:hypothetical protein